MGCNACGFPMLLRGKDGARSAQAGNRAPLERSSPTDRSVWIAGVDCWLWVHSRCQGCSCVFGVARAVWAGRVCGACTAGVHGRCDGDAMGRCLRSAGERGGSWFTGLVSPCVPGGPVWCGTGGGGAVPLTGFRVCAGHAGFDGTTATGLCGRGPGWLRRVLSVPWAVVSVCGLSCSVPGRCAGRRGPWWVGERGACGLHRTVARLVRAWCCRRWCRVVGLGPMPGQSRPDRSVVGRSGVRRCRSRRPCRRTCSRWVRWRSCLSGTMPAMGMPRGCRGEFPRRSGS